MKQSAVVLCEPETNPNLQWVEEVAALLPEESRLGWYQNVRPWLRMLPPDDEVAHLAYSMGYLALLTRTTPALVAAERVRLTATLERISTEMAAAVKTTADYHHRLNNRLGQLPGEIAQGLRPDALADQIVASVCEQFLNCGVPEVGRLLRGQVDSLRQLMAQHGDALIDFRQQLNESRSRATAALNSVKASGDAAKESIDLWSKEMRQVQWMCLGLVLLLGLLMGALFYWWVVDAQEAPKTKRAAATQQSPPSAPVSPRTARSESGLLSPDAAGRSGLMVAKKSIFGPTPPARATRLTPVGAAAAAQSCVVCLVKMIIDQLCNRPKSSSPPDRRDLRSLEHRKHGLVQVGPAAAQRAADDDFKRE